MDVTNEIANIEPIDGSYSSEFARLVENDAILDSLIRRLEEVAACQHSSFWNFQAVDQ